jgi:hypothetical protein
MDTIKTELTAEAKVTLDRVDLIANWHRLAPKIAATMALQDELLVGHIVQSKLSQRGPDTLGVVTGRLRRAVRPRKPVIGGNSVVSGLGANVRYLATHEFGFRGTVQVRAHERRSARFEGQRISLRDAKQIRGKALLRKLNLGTEKVKAHSRKVNIPARAPLLRGTQEKLDSYAGAVSDTIVQTFNTGGQGA